MTTLFYNLLMTDAVVGIGGARGGRRLLFLRITAMTNNIDN